MAAEGGLTPQIAVALDGNPVVGVLRATILTTNCFGSDAFTLSFALGPAPLSNAAFWAEVNANVIEVAAVRPDNMGADLLIAGLIDAIQIDPIRATATIEGRDLAARLIDSYSQLDFVNQSASEVVTKIAQQHGLTPIVTPTSGFVGRYYGDGFTRLSLGQFSRLRSDWDLVVELARENGFDAFVTGQCLTFQSPSMIGVTPIRIDMSDVISMRVERVLSVGDSPTARVQSWSSQDMASYVNQGQTPSADASDNTSPQAFLFTGSNLTFSQVNATASRYNTELQRLRSVLHLDMPWSLDLSPRSVILLTGTLSPLDGTYSIDRIERSCSVHTGAIQHIRAIAL